MAHEFLCVLSYSKFLLSIFIVQYCLLGISYCVTSCSFVFSYFYCVGLVVSTCQLIG